MCKDLKIYLILFVGIYLCSIFERLKFRVKMCTRIRIRLKSNLKEYVANFLNFTVRMKEESLIELTIGV